jgi:hypothetical protein
MNGTVSKMLGLSLCDGRRDGRPDDQVATVITEMPLYAHISSWMAPQQNSKHLRIAPWRNALQNGRRTSKHKAKNIMSRRVPLTDMKLHLEIFSHGVLHAVQARVPFYYGLGHGGKGANTYSDSTSSPVPGPDASFPKSRHTNALAHQG